MTIHFDNFVAALQTAIDDGATAADYDKCASRPLSESLSPSAAWTLLSIYHYRNRQRWAKELFESNFPPLMSPCDEYHGYKPEATLAICEFPDWQITIDPAWGGHVMFRDKASRELIVFQLEHDGEHFFHPDVLEPSTIARVQWSVEERFCWWNLRANPAVVLKSVQELVAAGFVDELRFDGKEPKYAPDAHRLSAAAAKLVPRVEKFFAAWDQPIHRPKLAALLGDWLTAGKLLRQTPQIRWTKEARRRAIENRLHRLELMELKLEHQIA